MRGAYRLVDEARRDSAKLAREYFDSEWAKNVPGQDAPDVDIPPYDYDWFEAAMRPHREAFKAADTPNDVLADIGKVAMKETENAGRRTMIRAVENTERIIGWARVDPVPPTCGFCLMLISRGPVYKTRETATFPKNDERNLYHAGCTCKAVPVYRQDRWDGRDQYLAMEKLWQESTKGYSGRKALNAFRRALEEDAPDSIPVAA